MVKEHVVKRALGLASGQGLVAAADNPNCLRRFKGEYAEEYDIISLQHHIDEANEVMFAKLRKLLDEEIPLHEIPERMKVLKINLHHGLQASIMRTFIISRTQKE